MMLDEDNITRQTVNAQLKEHHVELSHILEVSTMDLLIQFAEIGLGIACVIRDFVKKELEEGTLVDYLLKEGKSNSSRIVSERTKGAKLAKLDYRILEKKERMIPDDFLPEAEETGKTGRDHETIALVEILLHTGRHHQIRVQMSGAGMPLLGDRKYGKEPVGENGFQLALCAVSLEFFHPRTEKKMHFTCEPQGEYFKLF